VKNIYGTAVSYGKETENSSVLNIHRHCEDIAADGRLFQVLAKMIGNAWSLIMVSRVSGTASVEIDDEHRRCQPGSLTHSDYSLSVCLSVPVCMCVYVCLTL